MGQLFSNFAETTLAVAVSSGDAAPFTLTVTDGSNFPAIATAGGADYFYVVLELAAGTREILKVDQHTSGAATMNVVARAQESTTAASFTTSPATLVRLSLTATTVETVLAHPAVSTDAHAASAITNTPAGNIVATTVQAAIDELDTDKEAAGTAAAAVAAHTGDATDAHAASAITNTPAGNIVATTVQAAINELDTDKEAAGTAAAAVAAHTGDATDVHAASAITNTPAGNIVATTVQAAINELDTEKQTAAQVSAAISAAALPAATASNDGYMTSTYATKLDGIAAGANVGVAVDAGVHGVGLTALLKLTSAATVLSGGTVNGTKLSYVTFTSGVIGTGYVGTGTWKNISGETLDSTAVDTGPFQRIY